MQSQQTLSNQLEELSLQIGQAQQAAARARKDRADAAEAALARAERAAWVLGGAALGVLAAAALLRGGRS